ncbi:MAG: hypothetical protein KatS3mg105_1615 [Gemmatales bacterium]|nr:MAG: hypothetical protein KatS3mg105_1615 [Gemmatales bacterium]
MLVDLVQMTTRDGLILHGAYSAPERSEFHSGVDALCLVHGTGSNFYGSAFLEAIAGGLAGLGLGVLRINTRGHDLVSTVSTQRGGKLQGAAYEVVDDCRHDLAGWLDWLRQKGFSRVGLLGHSLGAVKCLYAAAFEPQLEPACVLAVSPPRLSYEWFCRQSQRDKFLETYRRAEELLQAGKGSELMLVPFPLPFLVTAGGYVEKYGPDERYNFLGFLRHVRCPVLATFGSVEIESNVAFMEAPQAVAELQRPNVAVEVIDGADHFYRGRHEELLQTIKRWLPSLQTDR